MVDHSDMQARNLINYASVMADIDPPELESLLASLSPAGTGE
jgi:hypothetical protein